MRAIKTIAYLCLLIVLASGGIASGANAQTSVYKRNLLKNAILPLSWSYPTRDVYSFPGCTTARIELKTKGGKAPVKIEYDHAIYPAFPLTTQSGHTYIMAPAMLPDHPVFLAIKATDAMGHVIKKHIKLDVGAPFIKPIHISSVTNDSNLTKDTPAWMVKVVADYDTQTLHGNSVPVYQCSSTMKIPYKNLQYVAEYSGGFKYKADRRFIDDINKGRTIKYYIKYDGGQSNKVVITLPKHIYKYKEGFTHAEAGGGGAKLHNTPFSGTDIVHDLGPGYNNILKGRTSCGNDFLTYEKAYVSRKGFIIPGAISGSYGASLSQHPRKGQIINLSNNRIRFDWHHLGWGMNYTATIEAQRHKGICPANVIR